VEEPERKFREYLASRKLKYTGERRTIFNDIISSCGYFEPEDLFKRLNSDGKSVSRATVYRTLDLLVKLGIVRRVCLGERSPVYENNLVLKPTAEIICLKCGRIVDFEVSAEIDAMLRQAAARQRTQMQNRLIHIYGHC